jgi:hypothetical protein
VLGRGRGGRARAASGFGGGRPAAGGGGSGERMTGSVRQRERGEEEMGGGRVGQKGERRAAGRERACASSQRVEL